MTLQQRSTRTTRSPLRNKLHIQKATRAEMAIAASLVSSSADWYRSIVCDEDMSEHEVDEVWAETNFQKRDFYIGYLNEKPIGTISLQYFGDYAYLGYIYLDVDYVGRGFGRRLMKFGEILSRRRGMKGMSLIAHPEAEWACKAYLKYGFQRAETKKESVLAWNRGALTPHYEEGFELYLYPFAQRAVDYQATLVRAHLNAKTTSTSARA